MRKLDQPEITKTLTEIHAAERARAKGLKSDARFGEWVTSLRQKYIVDGFMAPMYGALDGRWGRVKLRVAKYGNYLLPSEMAGKDFSTGRRNWVRNEEWFWAYLAYGQDMVSGEQSIPSAFKIEGVPGKSVWQLIVTIGKELNLHGEQGGGLFRSPADLDDKWLAGSEKSREVIEGEEGYTEPYESVRGLRWMGLFENYRRIKDSGDYLELRPAWFHVANHAFFNAPIERLPVFCAVFGSGGNLSLLRFLDDDLSEGARRLINELALTIPQAARDAGYRRNSASEKRNMRWWLWYNVGHGGYRKTLSYGDIAHLEVVARSTVQAAVQAFNNRLKGQLDGQLLGRLLMVAEAMGLGNNMVYGRLADKGLVPRRKNDIDSFDDIFKLI